MWRGDGMSSLGMLKIDIHTHILPEHWPDLQEKYGDGRFIKIEHYQPGCARLIREGEIFREVQCNCWDTQCRLADCQSTQVHVQVLSTVPVMFSYWAKPKHTLELSRFLNDHIAVIVNNDPKHFIGLGTLPMQATGLAIAELERCRQELNLAGVQIGSHVNGSNLDDPRFFPIYEAAQDLGAALFIHPWDMLAMDRMKKYWLSWLVGMPTEISLAICSMIFGGVFERFPKLRVAFAHGGGSFPANIGRIQHGFDVRPDLCALNNSIDPSDYLGRFFVDSLVHDPKMLRYLIDMVGADSVALGSDYPFPLGETSPGSMIETMNLKDDIKAKLFHGSALNWLNLKLEDFR